MIFLRLVLFLGLVLHKIVWEVMKVGEKSTPSTGQKKQINLKTLLKLVKVAFLVFLVIQTLFLNVLPILEDPIALRLIGLMIYIIGLAIALAGRIELGRNWANIEDYQVIPEQNLVQSGIYAYIRHPIYTGDVLLILGLELALNSWLVLVVIPLLIYVYNQTKAEEKILSTAFPGYGEYRSRTKMFIPHII